MFINTSICSISFQIDVKHPYCLCLTVAITEEYELVCAIYEHLSLGKDHGRNRQPERVVLAKRLRCGIAGPATAPLPAGLFPIGAYFDLKKGLNRRSGSRCTSICT